MKTTTSRGLKLCSIYTTEHNITIKTDEVNTYMSTDKFQAFQIAEYL